MNDSKRWPPLAVDHVVVAAHSLAQGMQWCKQLLGVTPGPGGEHGLMGTHNRLLSLHAEPYPLAYLEIIAINPAAPGPAQGRKRWFGLDDPALQARLQQLGPQLVHWVARCDDIDARCEALRAGLPADQGPGDVVAASRATAHGLLQWQIALRHDGRPAAGGAQPSLIQWHSNHPAQHMPASGLSLRSMAVRGTWPAAAALLLQAPGVNVASGHGPALSITLQTPLGERALHSTSTYPS